MRRIALVSIVVLFAASPILAQTDVRAWHEDGQTFVVWVESPIPTVTYEVYRAATAVADTTLATYVGRSFRGE